MNWHLIGLTYNVNQQRPRAQDLDDWLRSESLESGHVVAVALQEVPNAEIVKARPAESSWCEQVTGWMARKRFTLVHSLCLASNMLLVYFKQDLLHWLAQVEERWCRSSLWGTVGYKGTIGMRLTLRTGVELVFLTSHFFAEEKFNQERICQFQRALEQCTFDGDDDGGQQRGKEGGGKCSNRRCCLIWLGDFNFRVEGFTNSNEFIALLDGLEDVDQLGRLASAHDQLCKAKRAGQAFVGFEEAPIRFKPSYRIKVASGRYDPLRIPSWCDRVLYRVVDGSGTGNKEEKLLTIQSYGSCRHVTISDHFPVSAHFTLRMPSTHGVAGWPCHFQPIPHWEELIPFVCRLIMPPGYWAKFGSNLDWIGLYSIASGTDDDNNALPMVSRPAHWVYLLSCPWDEQGHCVVAEFQPLEAGFYKCGYFCAKRKCLQSLSKPFCVRKFNNNERKTT